MELKETVEMMQSNDYRERFKAEYVQLKIREAKLMSLILQIELADKKGEEGPKHDCPLWILRKQLNAMYEYQEILEARAFIEKIDLHFNGGIEK